MRQQWVMYSKEQDQLGLARPELEPGIGMGWILYSNGTGAQHAVNEKLKCEIFGGNLTSYRVCGWVKVCRLN